MEATILNDKHGGDNGPEYGICQVDLVATSIPRQMATGYTFFFMLCVCAIVSMERDISTTHCVTYTCNIYKAAIQHNMYKADQTCNTVHMV